MLRSYWVHRRLPDLRLFTCALERRERFSALNRVDPPPNVLDGVCDAVELRHHQLQHRLHRRGCLLILLRLRLRCRRRRLVLSSYPYLGVPAWLSYHAAVLLKTREITGGAT